MSVALELTGIEKRFGARRVLTGVSLAAQGGEIVAITGANGSGKSTLLKIVAGLLRPTRGETRLMLGEVSFSEPEQRRKSVGYVAPDVALYPELSGRENLMFFAQVRGASGLNLGKALERVGLGGREDDLVGVYSSGMKQRLRIALATLFDAPLLLLDEPGLALDSEGTGLLETLLREKTKSGALILLATNDAREVALADRAVDVAA
jgi:heme exporter protein A